MGLFDRISNGASGNGHVSESDESTLPDDLDESIRLEPSDLMGPVRARAGDADGELSEQGGEAPSADSGKATVISFANQKGGVAKTTTTLNLAVAFKES